MQLNPLMLKIRWYYLPLSSTLVYSIGNNSIMNGLRGVSGNVKDKYGFNRIISALKSK